MTANALPEADINDVLTRVGDDWLHLRGKTIFITGGTGFFGAWLLESFAHANESLSLGACIVALTRNTSAFSERFPHLAHRSDIRLHQGDVRDFKFPSGSFSHVIHAATDTYTRTSPTDASNGFLTILDGTRHVLDFAASTGIQRLLYVSSGAVYGAQPDNCNSIPETYSGSPDPFNPGSYYGEAKRACEFLCASHAIDHGYEMTSARCFTFVGPHLPMNGPYAIGNFIRDAHAGKPIRMTGDGTAVRSYLYAGDLAAWLWRILLTAPGGRSYNVGSDQPISIRELASLVASSFNTPKLLGCPTANPSTLPSRYLPDVRRAESELGLRVWTHLPEAIRKTAAWLNANDRHISAR